MPREPIPLIRQGGHFDAEKLFVLSYEGTVTEKKYFQDFRASVYFNNNGLIEIVPLKRPKDKGSDPFSVKKMLAVIVTVALLVTTFIYTDKSNWQSTLTIWLAYATSLLAVGAVEKKMTLNKDLNDSSGDK